MLCCHFQDLGPFDKVVVPIAGYFPRCKWRKMQVNPAHPGHIRIEECGVGMDWRLQRELANSSALALWHEFTINGSIMEHIKVFKYLGRLLA
jgi:hypothetical protein